MKTIKNYRYYVLALTICAAVLGLLAVPNEDTALGVWLIQMAVSKIIGLASALAAYILYNYWSSNDELPELTRSLNRR